LGKCWKNYAFFEGKAAAFTIDGEKIPKLLLK
jgi:hypothetical protein